MRCNRHVFLRVLLSTVCLLTLLRTASAQEIPSTPGKPAVKDIQFSGALLDSNGNALIGQIGVTFALYPERESGAPLWLETQNVIADTQGRYSALLGNTTGGLPLELFSSNEARWLGVRVNG